MTLIIVPWNDLFHFLMMLLAGAVVCGNVVAAKPSRRAPETMLGHPLRGFPRCMGLDLSIGQPG
ncbi:MAG: aldehyde dehydrogenase family protein [Methanocalculaceae archaeon]|nr:aldehyde dehydrogenase family protein [Methanocalculaceae archaeon]